MIIGRLPVCGSLTRDWTRERSSYNFDYPRDCSLTFSPQRYYLCIEKFGARSRVDVEHPSTWPLKLWYELRAMQTQSAKRQSVHHRHNTRHGAEISLIEISSHATRIKYALQVFFSSHWRLTAVGCFLFLNWYFAMWGIPIKSLAQFLRLQSDCRRRPTLHYSCWDVV